jgi:hypothetical protein
MWYLIPIIQCKKIACLLGMSLVCFSATAAEFALSMADIASPVFAASGIRLVLPMDGSANLQIAQLNVQQREFRKVRVSCAKFTLSSAQVACRMGRLDAMPDAKIEFSYEVATQRLQFALVAAGGESWRVAGRLGGAWQISAQLHNAQVRRLAPLLPADVPLPNGYGKDAMSVALSPNSDGTTNQSTKLPAEKLLAGHPKDGNQVAGYPPLAGESESVSLREIHFNRGTLNGILRVSGNASGMDAVNADVQLAETGFSDVSGLHAAEKLRGTVRLAAKRSGTEWRWQGDAAWQSGELFWQPLYLRGGPVLSASGRLDGKLFTVEQALADLPDVGHLQFSASWDVHKGVLLQGLLRGERLALAGLFNDYAKPFLGKGALAESALSGHADVDGLYREGELKSLRLGLHEAGVTDAEKRFALSGVNSEINWQADAAGSAQIAFAGGALLGVPLGAGLWTVNMNGLDFSVQQAAVPVLDGRLDLRDFRLYHVADPDTWRWQFAASVAPISMEKLSRAAGWPVMLGTLAGRIPSVSYDGNQINVDGALSFNLFDGTVEATQLTLANAFGRSPLLSGNLMMRNLDLDLLTRTFSFGNMQGRLDVDVKNLQLQDWQPVRFDGRIYSSAGNYPRKISQRAVQNISALGGAGAAAAIQRSFLRFFENFGYERIGLSCVLRNSVCAMGGIEEARHGSYAIIKGGGIPAITVMGYNRTVSWGELITRLKRVTQDNVTPIIQ